MKLRLKKMETHREFFQNLRAGILRVSSLALSLSFSWGVATAQAGSGVPLLNTVRFSAPGSTHLGAEGMVQLSGGSGVGGNLRFNHGLSELSNVNAFLGSGSGGHGFRVGGNLTFDFFPDIDRQPGLGVATQVVYSRSRALDAQGNLITSSSRGQLEVNAIPYLHKAFALAGADTVDPYLGVPIGLSFSGGRYVGTSSLVVGAIFSNSEKFFYNLELGIGLDAADAYFSGGMMVHLF